MNAPLVAALQGASLHVLLVLTSKVLARSGYGDIEILDRRRPKEKSRLGGHELACHTRTGDTESQVVAKVVRDTVRVRMLDELYGVLRRTQADLGILVTPFRLTKKASKALPFYGAPKIVVFDGETLARLLRRHKIGVRPDGSPDYAFFGSLELYAEKVDGFLQELQS